IMDGAGTLYGTTLMGGNPYFKVTLGTVFAVSAGNALNVGVVGSGRVTSSPAGYIDCPTRCNAAVAPGTQVQVTLIANPPVGGLVYDVTTGRQLPSGFLGWGGACAGNSSTP